MSWLNLNQSLNNIKGQISSFANEVLSEGIVEDKDPFSEITKANDRINELQALCASQEVEIDSLRRRNNDLQQTRPEHSLHNGNSSEKDDESSWFWDPPPEGDTATANFATQIASLQTKISALEEDAKKKKEQYEGTIEKLEAEAAHRSERREDGKGDSKKSKESLEEEVRRLKSEKEGLAGDLEELDGQHQAAMERMLQLKRELHKSFEVLKSDHGQLKELNGDMAQEIAELKSRNALLESKEETYLDKMSKSQSDLDTLQNKYMKLEKVYRILTEDAEKFQEDNQELQEENSRLQEEVTLLQSESVPKDLFMKVQADYERLKDNMSDSIMNSNEESVDSNNIDDNAKSVIENLKREITELQNKLTGNDDFKRLINESNAFKMRIEELEREKTKMAVDFQAQIDDMTAENELAAADLAHYEREAADMKKNNDFLIAEIGSARNASKLQPISESHEESLVKLESELEDCSRLNRSFEAEMELVVKELEEVKAERDSFRTDLADLRRKYETMSEQLDIFRDDTNACESFDKRKDLLLHDLQTKLNDALAEMDRSKQQISAVENEKRKIDFTILDNEKVLLLNEISELKAENQSRSIMNDYIKECEEDKMILEEKLEEMMQKLIKITDEKTAIEFEVTALRSIIEEREKETAELQSKFESLQNDLLELRQNKTDNELALMQEKNQSYRNEISELQRQNTALKAKIDEMEKRIQQHETENLSNRNDILELQQQNAALRTKIDKTEMKRNEISELQRQNAALKAKIEELNHATENKSQQLKSENLSFQNEISELQRQNEALKTKINELNQETENKSRYEISELQQQNEALKTKIEILNQETENKSHNEISEIQQQNEALKAKIDELNQETENKSRNEILELQQQNEVLKTKIDELNQETENKSQRLEAENLSHRNEISELQRQNALLKTETNESNQDAGIRIQQLETEKEELIKLVTLKHSESLSYHNEIQRLSAILVEKDKETNDLISQFEIKLRDASAPAEIPEEVKAKINELESRCQSVTKQLEEEQSNVMKVIQDKAKIIEREQLANRDLTRLRSHLAELEEDYTRELVQAEKKNAELSEKLSSIEEQAKKSSTVYTSNSIRANQEVETLRNQLRLVELQRDDIQARLDQSEDRNSKHGASLTNLQCVLEQFQLDKERDVESAAMKLRSELADSIKQQEELRAEISWLNGRLQESSNGLKAASRLGGQLEAKSAQINEMREQVLKLQTELKVADEKYRNAIGNQQDRVDKSLVKNLLLGFVQANNQQRMKDGNQVLKILSTVLDFNQSESERAGLSNSKNFLGGQPESLTQEFIKFLEKESRPNQLPTMLGLTSQSRESVQNSRPSTPSSRAESASGNPDFPRKHSRNISTGSQNILFQSIDSIEGDHAPPSNALLDIDRPSRLMLGPVDPGISQTRNSEGAILKNVLKDV